MPDQQNDLYAKETIMRVTCLLAGLLLAFTSLAGCSLAPAYVRPAAPVPDQWPGPDQGLVPVQNPGPAGPATADPPRAAALVPGWQEFVADPALGSLVASALANNRDLRQALLNIAAVRAQYRITRADQVPGISGQASDTRQRLPGDLSPSGASSTGSHFQAGLGLNAFELDLFGRVKSLSEAALQAYLAQEMTARASRVSLIANVIQAYITRSGARAEYDLTAQTLASREVSLDLIGKQRRYGAGSDLDFQEALGLKEEARARLEVAARGLARAENSLALLTGIPAAALPKPGMGPMVVQGDLGPGLPSDLLARRPDILAAEHDLMARHADIGAARAAFFPRISLTGFLGTASADLSGLLGAGSMAWNFSPQLALPLFDAGRNQAAQDLAEIRRDMAVARYEYAIQTAFREVADALAVRETLKREAVARQAMARSSAASLRLSEARYRHGADSHLRFLDAQRSDFTNQIALIQTRTDFQIALVDLFKALGGGWDPLAGQGRMKNHGQS